MGKYAGVIYKITVTNWEKYNSTLKKGHHCILLSTSFLSDAKIRVCSPVTRLLYLSCLLVAGESKRSQIEVSHESLVFQSGVKSESLESQLTQLQSLQLLTFEKNASLLDRIGIDRKRKDRIGGHAVSKQPVQAPAVLPPVKTNEVIACYAEKWKSVYQASPPILGKDAGILKRVVNDLGVEKTKTYLKAYLEMRDAWFLTKRHDLPTFAASLNSIAQYVETGRAFTRQEIRNAESAQTTQNMLDMIDRGEV